LEVSQKADEKGKSLILKEKELHEIKDSHQMADELIGLTLTLTLTLTLALTHQMADELIGELRIKLKAYEESQGLSDTAKLVAEKMEAQAAIGKVVFFLSS